MMITGSQTGSLTDFFHVFQTPFRHPPDTHQTPTKVQPPTFHKSSRAGLVGVTHFTVTLWSNWQDCKISSRAEIPMLDRVWQYCIFCELSECSHRCQFLSPSSNSRLAGLRQHYHYQDWLPPSHHPTVLVVLRSYRATVNRISINAICH